MNRRQFLWSLGAATGVGLGGAGYARWVEPRWIQFSQHGLPEPPGRPWPISSIAHISDLHLQEVGDLHRSVAAEITERQPELIVLTGDSVDGSRWIPVLREFLGHLPHAIPKFAILGNWEHWGGVDPGQLEAAYGRANCELLVNRSVEHRTASGSMWISGVDDLVGGRPDLGNVLGGEGAGLPHLLLAHCPAHRDQVAQQDGAVDLILSGHTHGGQVQVLGRAPVVPRGSGRYVEGWYREEGPPMFVSRGVGTSVLPVRMGARPEVAFLNR